MGKMLKIGNPKKHIILELLNNINNPLGVFPGIIDFSLDKDNLYIPEENIRSEIWKYSDIYNQNCIKNLKRDRIKNNPESIAIDVRGLLKLNPNIAEEVYSLNMWNRYKQIYKINNSIDKNFIHDEDIKLSFGIFDKLPFDSFFIEYPEDMQNVLSNKNIIIGTFVTFIHDIDAVFDDGYNFKSKYNKLYFMDLMIEKGKSSYPILAPYGIREDESNGKYIKDIVDKYLMSDSILDMLKGTDIGKNMYVNAKIKLISYIIQSVLYICSDDITTTLNNQANELKTNMSKIKNKNITISEIGYNIPEEDILIKEDVDRRNRKVYNDNEYTGRTNRPHWRKAHWHYYWCGKGKKELRLKFLLPILVNGDRVNEKITTIVRNKTLDIQ